MPGEFDLIDWIRTQQRPTDLVTLPAGDDLAVLAWPPKDLLLVGVDQALDGRHFDARVHPPGQIGRKVMNRNLSDCAAMACLPAAAVVSMALPRGTSLDFAKALYLGIRAAGDAWYCAIVGGDTASWDGPLAVSVTILGRSAGTEPITRRGAVAGDGIYVTGPLGGAWREDRGGRHMTFEPRVALGRQLAKYRPVGLPCIKAMIDLSDGLSRDLRHLLEANDLHPQLGAELEGALIPVHPDAIRVADVSGRSPLHHALHDGEDYELLFTCPVRPPNGTRIGTVTDAPGVLLDGVPLPVAGWEHPLGT